MLQAEQIKALRAQREALQQQQQMQAQARQAAALQEQRQVNSQEDAPEAQALEDRLEPIGKQIAMCAKDSYPDRDVYADCVERAEVSYPELATLMHEQMSDLPLALFEATHRKARATRKAAEKLTDAEHQFESSDR